MAQYRDSAGAKEQRGSVQARVLKCVAVIAVRPWLYLLMVSLQWRPRLPIRLLRLAAELIAPLVSPVAKGTTIEPVVVEGVSGEWIYPATTSNGGGVIYFAHGSGYAFCSLKTHRGFASRLAENAGVPVFSVDYRLAPEHRFPSAADDVAAGYQWLLAQGIDARKVVVAGDSAGGHLMLDLILELLRTDHEPPNGCLLFSPVVDFSGALASEGSVRRDPLFTVSGAARLRDLYTTDMALDTPRIALDLSVGAASKFPPTLIQVGGAEMLTADARFLQASLMNAGAACELQIWPDQMHVFQMMHRVVPEARTAMGVASDFVCASLSV